MDGKGLVEDFRTNDGATILRRLEVIYETPLQFSNWWLTGRVQINEKNQEWLNKGEVEVAISSALQTWSKWDDETKKVYLNACFYFSRSFSYEWDYEKFMALYTYVDVLWWLQFRKQKGVRHEERLNKILERLDLYQNPTIIEQIAKARNGLFHEGCGEDISPYKW